MIYLDVYIRKLKCFSCVIFYHFKAAFACFFIHANTILICLV